MGPNSGRKFKSCAADKCDYHEWCQDKEVDQHTPKEAEASPVLDHEENFNDEEFSEWTKEYEEEVKENVVVYLKVWNEMLENTKMIWINVCCF